MPLAKPGARPHRSWAPAALALLWMVSSCGGRKENVPQPTGAPEIGADEVLLEVAGIAFTRGELDAISAPVHAGMPNAGRKARWRAVLEHALQVRLAHRKHGGEMAELRERAQALADATRNGGYPELVRQGEAFGGRQEERPQSRGGMPPAVADFVFKMENLGQVSDPIATPQGYHVVSCELVEPGTSSDQDLAHVYFVPFLAIPGDAFDSWWKEVRPTLRDQVTKVHPELTGALPPWLQDP